MDRTEILKDSYIDGKNATVGEIWDIALSHLAEACAAFYDLDSEEAVAAGFMTDSILRYASAIKKEIDPRSYKEE